MTTAFGQGMPRVTVSLTGPDGVTRKAITSQFGYYRFDNVVSGQSYTVQASAKRYRFTPRIVTVMGELTDVDITPNE